MEMPFVAFDVETPNRQNNRICSIGISIINPDGTIATKEYLVNPECCFDQVNMNIHGISEQSIENAPTFPSIWDEISPLFQNHIVVAHNASFDLNVLHKSLSAYNISAPCINYICTMKMSQALLSLENYKLPTLCGCYGISLEHHNAGSDSEACARILQHLLSVNVILENFVKVYDLGAPIKHSHGSSFKKQVSESTKSLNELSNILKEISKDGVLSDEEITFLIEWMNENYDLRGNFPYDRIYDKLLLVLEDGIIDERERTELIQLFQFASDPVEKNCCSCLSYSLVDKNICLSGNFDHGTKEEVESIIIRCGGNIQKSITQKTNILVVGGQGNSAWSASNYGNKIKKALELQEKKGIDIVIVRESDFFKLLES